MKHQRRLKVGDVVKNILSGCRFVVEKSDLDIMNMDINSSNYTYLNKNYGKPPDKRVNEYIVEMEVPFLKFFKTKKNGRIMRDPDNGKTAFTTKAPYCLDCNKPTSYL